MRTKLLWRIGAPLLVIVAAALAGYLWLTKTRSPEQELADTVRKSQHVFSEYFNADYERAKAAILDHVLLLDSEKLGSADCSEKSLGDETDRMDAIARSHMN